MLGIKYRNNSIKWCWSISMYCSTSKYSI